MKRVSPSENAVRRSVEEVASILVDAAVSVHRELGPGLLESVYQACLAYELAGRGLVVRCEVPQRIEYRALQFDAGYRLDMLIEDQLIVENKSVEQLLPIHAAQLLTYLKLSNLRVGFLLNWNVVRMKDGIRRYVNGF